jgi:hypothetical protein
MQEPFNNNDEDNFGEHDEEYLENLRMENEIKKIKLSLEHGTDLSGQLSEAELPPEIEGKFLDYISQFEAEFAKRKTIFVYDLAGRPEWKPASEIPDSEIAAELERIMDAMHENSISLDTICEVDDRVLYKFITEELFNHETNDIQIPGMTHGFIYEEFHPNHEHDIKNRCTDFLKHVLNKESEWMPRFLSLAKEVSSQTGVITEDEAINKLTLFRDAFSSFTIENFEIATVHINEETDLGEAQGSIHFTGTIDGSHETIDFNGGFGFWLIKEYDWWNIYKMNIPGIIL